MKTEHPKGYIPVISSQEEMENFIDAVSDALCWLDGFKAGGGEYSPSSVHTLRDLNIRLKDALK